MQPVQNTKFYYQVKSLAASSEVRWVVFSLVLLLVLLLGYRINIAASSDEKTVVLFAFLLAPFRQMLEGTRWASRALHDLRPWGEGGGGAARYHQGDGGAVDYDALVTRILNHDRFRAIVEKLAGEQVREMEGRLGAELRQLEVMLLDKTKQLELLVNQTRNNLQVEVDKVISLKGQLRKEGDGGGGEAENGAVGRQIVELEAELTALKVQLASLDLARYTTPSGPAADAEAALAAVADIQSRISNLDESLATVAGQVKSCCSRVGDIPQVVHSAIESLVSSDAEEGLVSRLSANLVTRPELAAIEGRIQEELKADSLKIIRAEVLAQVDQGNASQTGQSSSSQEVETIVRKALAKYDADKTGLFDFALESAGGSILTTRCTENYELSSAVISVFGVPFWWETNNPRSILQPGSAPGQCWAFKGSHGSVVVRLSAEILVQAVSIEHISHLSTPDGKLSSAPKNISISGLRGEEVVPLANITYDITSDPVQTFWFQTGDQGFNTVELNVLSNHGHPDYTCLYRLRVHGVLVDPTRLH